MKKMMILIALNCKNSEFFNKKLVNARKISNFLPILLILFNYYGKITKDKN